MFQPFITALFCLIHCILHALLFRYRTIYLQQLGISLYLLFPRSVIPNTCCELIYQEFWHECRRRWLDCLIININLLIFKRIYVYWYTYVKELNYFEKNIMINECDWSSCAVAIKLYNTHIFRAINRYVRDLWKISSSVCFIFIIF